MHIAHIAIWTNDLELMKTFYCKYLGGICGPKYTNATKAFESYFIRFDSGAQIELMHKPTINHAEGVCERIGITHIAFQLASATAVIDLTNLLRNDAYVVASEARTTGDGYFESVILDPEGNRIELVA